MTLILSLSAVAASDPDARADTRLYDPAELLTAAEQASLTARLDSLSTEHGVELYMATYCAEDEFDNFIGDDYCATVRNLHGRVAVLLIVTYDLSDGCYYYNMYTYGQANYAITGNESDYIMDQEDVYRNLKGGAICSGAEAFFDWSLRAYSGHVGVSYLKIAGIALIPGVLIGVATAAGVAGSYRKRRRSVDYPLDQFAKLELTAQSDTFAGRSVTRSYEPRSSGGSGGGSCSTHGGGSGHRGGR